MIIVTKQECEKALQRKISDDHFKNLFNVILSVSTYIDSYETDDIADLITFLFTFQGFKSSSICNYKKEVKTILKCVQDQ